MTGLTHFDKEGKAIMVDIGDKESTLRIAMARGAIKMQPETLSRILDNRVEKGDVFSVARLAGIMAAKKTSGLIPLCHPLFISSIAVEFSPDASNSRVGIEATVKVNGQTGVEMEALTAVSVAALTIYDMCKAVDKTMMIDNVHLAEKRGGRSGHFINPGKAANMPSKGCEPDANTHTGRSDQDESSATAMGHRDKETC